MATSECPLRALNVNIKVDLFLEPEKKRSGKVAVDREAKGKGVLHMETNKQAFIQLACIQ